MVTASPASWTCDSWGETERKLSFRWGHYITASVGPIHSTVETEIRPQGDTQMPRRAKNRRRAVSRPNATQLFSPVRRMHVGGAMLHVPGYKGWMEVEPKDAEC